MNIVKDTSSCGLGPKMFPRLAKCSLVLIELEISKARSVGVGCLHTFSASLLANISDWIQRTRLLWIKLSINPSRIMSVNGISEMFKVRIFHW